MNMRMRLKKSVWRLCTKVRTIVMVALLTWTFQSDVEEELGNDHDHENEIDNEFDGAGGAKQKKTITRKAHDELYETVVKVESDVKEDLDDDHSYQNDIDEVFEEPGG